MTRIDHGDGPPVRLAAPFDNLEVVYPFAWHKPGRVHLYDRREMSGTVYSPEYARALAEAILAALGGIVLTDEDVAAVRVLLATGLDAYLDSTHGPRLRALAERLGMRT